MSKHIYNLQYKQFVMEQQSQNFLIVNETKYHRLSTQASYNHSKTSTRLYEDLLKQLQCAQQQFNTLQIAVSQQQERARRALNQQLHNQLVQLDCQNVKLRQQQQRLMNKKCLKNMDVDRVSEKPLVKQSSCISVGFERIQIDHKTRHISNKSRHPDRMTKIKNIACFDDMGQQNKNVFSSNIYLHFYNAIFLGHEPILKTSQVVIPETYYQVEIEQLKNVLEQSKQRCELLSRLINIYIHNLSLLTQDIDCFVKDINTTQQSNPIYTKIKDIANLKEQIQQIKQYLRKPAIQAQEPQCLGILISLFTDEAEQSKLIQIKKIRNMNLAVDKKHSKMKQLVESIRSGRCKFQQIRDIYIKRIADLQQKLL